MTESHASNPRSLENTAVDVASILGAEMLTFSRNSYTPSSDSWKFGLARKHREYGFKIEDIGESIQKAYEALMGKDRTEILAFGRYIFEPEIISKRAEYNFLMVLIIAHGYSKNLQLNLKEPKDIFGPYGKIYFDLRIELGLEKTSRHPQEIQHLTLEGMVKDILSGKRNLLPESYPQN